MVNREFDEIKKVCGIYLDVILLAKAIKELKPASVRRGAKAPKRRETENARMGPNWARQQYWPELTLKSATIVRVRNEKQIAWRVFNMLRVITKTCSCINVKNLVNHSAAITSYWKTVVFAKLHV